MKPRNCLVLVATSLLAMGCASARAQDAGSGPQPQQPPVTGREDTRPKFDFAEAKRRLTERLAQIEKRIADLTGDHAKEFDVEERDQLTRHADMLRERIAQIDAGKIPDSIGPPQGGRGPQNCGGPDAGPPMGGRRLEQGADGVVVWGPGGGPMHGPGPSMEERLAQIERAVHEMREMFERHHVAPEMRERAEREMELRRGGGGGAPPDGRPGEGPPPGERPGPGGGDGRPQPRIGSGWDNPPEQGARLQPPRPPAAPREGVEPRQMENVKRMVDEQIARARAQMDEQLAVARKQLADAQAALAKAQAEIEELRKNEKK